MGVAQNLDGETLKKHRKAGMGFGPGKAHLAYSVLRADNPRGPGMQKRLKLTTVQMPPYPLPRMIMQRPLGATLRAWPLQTFGMFHPDINPLLLGIKVNFTHKPRIFKTQQMMVQIGITHDLPPFRKQVYHPLLPTENPEDPFPEGRQVRVFYFSIRQV
jgi:hypothetical protein